MTAEGFDSIVVASNRGPVTFAPGEAGELVATRGSGGVVTALTHALEEGGVWIAAAMTDGDREMAARHAHGRIDVAAEDAKFEVRYLEIPPATFDGYYNFVSNGILWFAHHYLWDTVHTPVWGPPTQRAWGRYAEVNRMFAEAIAEEGAKQPGRVAYLVQDYHLSLVPQFLRELVPDALIAHFSHTPFSGPTHVRILPTQMRRELLQGLLGADVLGFHSEAWAENFLMSARAVNGAKVDLSRSRVHYEDREILARVHPMSVEAGPLRAEANSPEVRALRRELEDWRGEAKLVLRVDRMELSKNILRGFLAYETFLERYPKWQGKVKFLALLSPSRTELPEYQSYAQECMAEADRVNERFGRPDWRPIEVRMREDYLGAVAAYGLYDVLFVNPAIDGLNLVSMEGPVVNRRHGVLVLSRNAGAYRRLRRYALGVNPYDLNEQADAIAAALTMPDEDRGKRARGLSRLVASNPPARWVNHQLRDLDRVARRRAWFQSSAES